MTQKTAIILLGAPGSGKGTQGELLEERTSYPRYVMSDLIKMTIKKRPKVLAGFDFASGALLGDLEIFKIFRTWFKSEDTIIIDGVPRTLDQAYWLYGFLTQHEYKIKVLFLSVDEKKLLERIKARGRIDDDPKIFKERLKIYDGVKEVILQVYKKNIVEVNGDQSIQDVQKEVNRKLRV
jgi:adenylate kinase